MPIVTVESTLEADPARIERLLEEIQSAGVAALGGERDNIWARFRPVDPRHFRRAPDPAQNPVIVTIEANAGRTREQKQAFVRGAVDAIARALQVPSSLVWTRWQELDPREIGFGPPPA